MSAGKETQKLWGIEGDWSVSSDIDLTDVSAQEKPLESQILAVGDKKLDFGTNTYRLTRN